MIVDIGDLLPRLHIYEVLFPKQQRLAQMLFLTYGDFLDFCYEAKNALRKPKRSLFKTPWKNFEAQFGQMKRRFEYNKEQIAAEVEVSHLIESAGAHESIRAVQMELSEDRRRESSKRVHYPWV